MGVGVTLPGVAADLSVGAGEQGVDRALGDLVLIAVTGNRGREGEVGVGEYAVDRCSGPEGIGRLAEELLDLGAANVAALVLEAVEIVLVDGEARLLPRPGAESLGADLEQLRFGERGGRIDPAAAAPRPILARPADLVDPVAGESPERLVV